MTTQGSFMHVTHSRPGRLPSASRSGRSARGGVNMIGKFDPVLYFRHGSNTLDVCGPIFWDLPRDQNLEIRVEVELFQSGQSVNGNTGGTHFRPPDDEWMIYINTNN